MMEKAVNKVVLAYSGGLDTSVMIRWLIEHYGCEVIALAADVGQEEFLEPLREKALKTGASKVYLEDLKDEFARDYCLPVLQANAVYEGKYLLSAAISRPLISKHLVEVARKEEADAVAHGSTGKGNDQVRFEVSVMALAPDLRVLAPVRTWEFKSREEEIEYAKRHDIPVRATKEKPYSIDRNLWGISIECGVLEDPWVEPPADVYIITKAPEEAPDKPRYLEVSFEEGVPVAVDGKEMSVPQLLRSLNQIAGEYGIGRQDLVENRLVGIKSREVYEAPGATVLHIAHRELENLTLDRDTFHFKESLVPRYAELVYYGLWFSPLKGALDAFVKETQRNVSGVVRMKLYKGQCVPVARKSEFSLYDFNLATYDAADTFDHQAGESFCKIWGLPLRVRARVEKRQRG
ncbi:MAG: argininosuccinate synthase [bacterium]